MARKYKMPRTYKSPETYQKFIDGAHKGGQVPKNITPEIRERLREGARITNEKLGHKVHILSENKETN